jgi:GTP-binding protein
LTKCDALSADEVAARAKALARVAKCKLADVHRISGVTGLKVPELMRAALMHIRDARAKTADETVASDGVRS